MDIKWFVIGAALLLVGIILTAAGFAREARHPGRVLFLGDGSEGMIIMWLASAALWYSILPVNNLGWAVVTGVSSFLTMALVTYFIVGAIVRHERRRQDS